MKVQDKFDKLIADTRKVRAEIANVKANYELLKELLKELVIGCYPEKLKDALKVKLAALEAAERVLK